jgi:uncharacterized peroxidase-related enzyme
MPELVLPLIDPQSAQEPARTALAKVQTRYGFVPNLYRVFANAPIAVDAYLAVSDAFEQGSLSPTERNLVLLSVSRENTCTYCVAVHSAVADMQKDRSDIVEAVRTGKPIDDRKLEAVRKLAQALVRNSGHAEAEVREFVAAGYAPHQVIEVIVGIALKTLSNYTNHLTEPPLDTAFAGRAWRP